VLTRPPRAAARPATAVLLSAILVALGAAGPAAWPARAAAGAATAADDGAATAAGDAAAGGAAAGGAGQQARASDLAELAAIDVPAAWQVTRGRGVIVAVLDTGVDSRVPDLRGSVITGPDYTRGANPPGYRPPHWHGTFIASLIAGHGSGPGLASGVIGVAPAARILSVRVILDDNEPGFPIYNANAHYEDAIASGIRYAVRRGAGVINMSLGSASAAPRVREAVGYAISRGVVVVASAGNDGAGPGRSQFSYPASYTGVISVGAVDAEHQRAPFSDRNASVVLCAPGVDVVGAAPGGGYLAVNGTSPASAFVAGVAALIRSRYPRLGPALVRQALVSSARYRPAGGYSAGAGFGEVDAAAALRAAAGLAARRPAQGLAPATAHFGSGPPPGAIRVVRRDAARIAVRQRLADAGAAGFLISLLALAVVIGRGIRRPARAAARAARLARRAAADAAAVATGASGSRSRRQ
jgi:type VII secretion-associated serine protease mycosin